MHSAVYILIMHLNIIHMQDTQCQMCAAEYLHTTGELHCSKNVYAHILYI